jgi:hypothetical protein
METEKAKEIRRKETEKTGIAKKAAKEGVKKKRTKDMRKTAKKKTTTKEVITIKDIKELVDYCKQQFGRKPFQGASVDFHPKKPAYVYIPDNSVTKVDTQKLLDFLKERNVRSVLVDALNKKKAPVLAELCDAGIEVYVLRRTNQIKRMREELERHGIKVPKTDKYDAVLLAFTPPKKWALVDARFLRCWEAMVRWRDAERSYQRQDHLLKTNNSKEPTNDREKMLRKYDEKVLALLDEAQKLAAEMFIEIVKSNYPGVDEGFDEFGIKDDDITKAYYCEAFLEALHCDSPAGYLVKSGIGVAGSPPPKQRRKEYIYDRRLKHVLDQLAAKVYHLNIYDDNDRKKVKTKARKLAKKIWKRAKKIKKWIEGGRVGEALGPAPLEKRGFIGCHPRPSGRGLLRKQESGIDHPAPGPKHTADRPPQP